MTSTQTAAPQVTRNIERKSVVGSGGRLRTVSICETGCWHGSHAQAMKCINGLGDAVSNAYRAAGYSVREAHDAAVAAMKAERAARKARKG